MQRLRCTSDNAHRRAQAREQSTLGSRRGQPSRAPPSHRSNVPRITRRTGGRELETFYQDDRPVGSRSSTLRAGSLRLPTEHSSLRQVLCARLAKHVQHLRSMVHAVRDDVSDASPVRLCRCMLVKRSTQRSSHLPSAAILRATTATSRAARSRRAIVPSIDLPGGSVPWSLRIDEAPEKPSTVRATDQPARNSRTTIATRIALCGVMK